MPKLLSSFLRALLVTFLLTLSSVGLAEQVPNSIPSPTNSKLNDMGELTDGRVTEKPQIEKLGNEQYRIGTIKVDKAKRFITVPGKMLSNVADKPIEFLATMKNGYKSYESVFMLDVNAFEFNLACILIGLDSSNAVPPKYHFDPEPVKGDPVSIRVSWKDNGKSFDYDPVELLKDAQIDPNKKASTPTLPSTWSYTGSMFVEGDQYLAQMDGVLIGLVHDPASVIEHREGLGFHNYGSFTIDTSKTPKTGQEILITIQALN